MPRGPGKKENYNFDYARFNGVDEEVVEIQRKQPEGDSPIPDDMFRQLPGELQEAFRLMQISRQTGDEKAQVRANELALKAVEKGGPEMKMRFQQEVMQQSAKNPETKKAMEELLNGSSSNGNYDNMSKVENLSTTIDRLHDEMQAGANTAARQADELKRQQEILENIESPEDFARFLSNAGLSQEDMQRVLTGDEAFMRQTFDKAINRLETPEVQNAMKKADVVLDTVDDLHSKLVGDNPDFAPPAVPSRPVEPKPHDAPVRAPPRTPSAPEPKIPEHRVQYEKDGSGRLQSVQLRCELPGVQAMAEIEVDVSERHLRVRTLNPAYVVNVGPFPALVDATAARAKFSKKKQELTLTVPAKP